MHRTDSHRIKINPSMIIITFFLSIFIEHKYSDRMQSQNSQLVLSIYTSENGNKGGIDVSLGKKFYNKREGPRSTECWVGMLMEVWKPPSRQTPRVKTWDSEGSIEKCENRVPPPKLHYVHHSPAGSSGPAHHTWVLLQQNLAMPVFMWIHMYGTYTHRHIDIGNWWSWSLLQKLKKKENYKLWSLNIKDKTSWNKMTPSSILEKALLIYFFLKKENSCMLRQTYM